MTRRARSTKSGATEEKENEKEHYTKWTRPGGLVNAIKAIWQLLAKPVMSRVHSTGPQEAPGGT
jgi:hypothetical protein